METCNPNATVEAKQMLDWFEWLPNRTDRKVVSGQQFCCGWDLPPAYGEIIRALYDQTGVFPGLIGVDYAYGDWSDPENNPTLIDYWRKGGLITLSWQATNPWTGGAASDRNMNGGDFSDLYTPGNAAYVAWHADLDTRAGWLNELQDAGVVVLWRPFQEMNGCWTWWACRDQAKFIAHWIHTWEYLTWTHGLNNLLWVYGPNKDENDFYITAEFYYPGNDYVDIVGLDYYLTAGYPDLSDIDLCGRLELLLYGKPFALTEFGPTGFLPACQPPVQHIPQRYCFDYSTLITDIKAHCPEVVYFLAWGENYSMIYQNNADVLLADSWVINREEVNWWADTEDAPVIPAEQEVDICFTIQLEKLKPGV